MSLIECRRCGSSNSAEHRFCSACGTSLANECDVCGFFNETSADFCGGCGLLLRNASDVDRSRAFIRSNMPKNLAERIMRVGPTLEGERKQVTVLFVDIKGSTELIEDLDAEQALKRLAPVLKIVMDAVHRYEGIVNRIEGDGVMALFGTPISREDHANCACLAAIAMRDEMARQFGQEIGIRVGINSGEVVVHSVKNDLSITYDAAGKTVHLAARMESLAPPGTVYVTAETFSLVEGFVEANELGPISIKGLKKPRRVYELVRALPSKTRWKVRAERGLTKLIGREFELARLRKAQERAGAGNGQIVSIVGEPGVGKSRLAHQFTDFGELSGWTRLESAADQLARHTTYLPISDLLRSWLDISPEDPKPAVSRRVRERVLELNDDFSDLLPAIHSLLDLEYEADAEWPQLDPSQRRYKIVDAVVALLLTLSEQAPLLILIEDLHWIDAGSRAVLETIAESIANHRILMITSFRPEYEHSWADIGNHSLIKVCPMGGDEINSFTQQLLGEHESLGHLKQHLSSSVEGNPLFIEEIVNSLVETGVLEGDTGAYRMTQDIAEVQIPATVETILTARIDGLRATDKGLLQTAAVLGKDVPLVILQSMTDLAADELRSAVEKLEAADFMVDARRRSQSECSFKHELTRDVAYHSLLREVRRQLHAEALVAMESCYQGRLEEQYDRLAHHAFRGEDWHKAVDYHLKSLVRAVRRWANKDAATIFERGITALSHLPKSTQRSKADIDFRLIVVSALVPLGSHNQLIEILEQADVLACEIEDYTRMAAVSCQLSVAHWMNGNHSAALATADRALEICRKVNDTPLRLAALHNRGMAFHETGDFHNSVDVLREALHTLTDEMDRKRIGWAAYPSVSIRTFMADSLFELGDFGEADSLSSEALALADAANHAYSQTMIYHVRARIHIVNGEYDEALILMNRAWEICQRLQIYKMYPIIAARLIEVHLARGDLEAAFDAFSLTEQQEEEQYANLYGWSQLKLARGSAYLALDRLDEARAEAESCIQMVLPREERPKLAYAYKLLGDVFSRSDGRLAEGAEEYYQKGISTAAASGMRPLEAECHRCLSSLYSGAGRDADASAAWNRALKVFAQSA